MILRFTFLLFVLALGLLAAFAAPPTAAQQLELKDRPISEIRIAGTEKVDDRLVRNQVRLAPGDPYDSEVVNEDIVRITHLGRFVSVRAEVTPKDDGTLILTYHVEEQPLLEDVQVVGNKALSDQELLAEIVLRRGDPADEFLIEDARRSVEDAYGEKGFFVTDVSIDRESLEASNILLIRVREGPRVRTRQIRFEGNGAFTAKQLRSEIESQTWLPLLRRGDLSRQRLDRDASRIRDFYQARGYLDAEVGRRIDLSPDQTEASVTFVIKEGAQYTVAAIEVEGARVFPARQVREAMTLQVGDVFSQDRFEASREAVRNLYGKLGFIEADIAISRLFHETDPRVDLRVRVEEGEAYRVGQISIRGNAQTQDKVILRQVRGMRPGRRFDQSGISITRRRLSEGSFFDDAKVTIQPPQQDPPPEAGPRHRDVIIEVTEANTGSVSFGAGVSSDAGVIGAIDLTQRNFDIADTPDSLGELATGQAFRGAGQFFSLTLQPGNDRSLFQVSFREPALLESDLFLDTQFSFFQREREDWDEQRLGGSLALGRHFGDVWSARVRGRAQEVEIDEIDPSAPVDVFEVEGSNLLTEFGFFITRNTTDSNIFPTRGSRSEIGISRAGVLGGDFDFTKLSTEFRKFWTVDEDFFGRKTVLSLRNEIGFIFEDDEAPTFERFFAGGHRSFRGFDFRGAGPRGIRNDTGVEDDDPVGGRWLFLLGLEYNFPIFQETLRGVVFADSGTVDTDPDFSKYRLSVGAGVRLRLPFLGRAPFAIDFAVPVAEEDGDETQLISFDLALPF